MYYVHSRVLLSHLVSSPQPQSLLPHHQRRRRSWVAKERNGWYTKVQVQGTANSVLQNP